MRRLRSSMLDVLREQNRWMLASKEIFPEKDASDENDENQSTLYGVWRE
jgi:hypothetical protein